MPLDPEKKALIDSLRETLASLLKNPCQHLENPSGCPRRASVALIVRIRPHFDHWQEEGETKIKTPLNLQEFFSMPWVQNGDPEVAFIKRASREGDRWTSHVALPGGKRDPEDKDDKSVAVRETAEEIGLDLTSDDVLFVGNLSERVVSAAWGKVPFMVLCPFVFLWTKPVLPPLRLQPGEVASIHWVPLRIMLSPSSYTYTYVNTSDRFARRGGPIMKYVVRSILGLMEFSAIRLLPSESLYCTSTEEFFPKNDLTHLTHSTPRRSLFCNIYNHFHGQSSSSSESSQPLLLWGLTLGILIDFLNQLPPYNAIQLWTYPTFTAYDVRLVIKIMTMSLRRRNKALIQGECESANEISMISKAEMVTFMDNPFSAEEVSGDMAISDKNPCWNQSYAIGVMLEGYYDIVRKGAIFATSLRLVGAFTFMFAAVRIYKQRNL